MRGGGIDPYQFEDKEEEWHKKDVDEDSLIYIGAVSLFGETNDTICQFNIDKTLSNKLIEIISKNGEEFISRKLIEALSGL